MKARVIERLNHQLDALKAENRELKAQTPKTVTECVFFDCDDCLYQNDWQTADKITQGIATYVRNNLELPDGVSTYALYKKYGTSAKGLLAEGYLDAQGVADFLHNAHLIDYSDIHEDAKLRTVVQRVAPKRWIFTAAPKAHAERCLARLGIPQDLFLGVIDCHACNLETKHNPLSFNIAMEMAGVADASACLLCDDSVKNIEAAKKFGWRTVLVGKTNRDNGAPVQCDFADFHISSMHQLPEILPELF